MAAENNNNNILEAGFSEIDFGTEFVNIKQSEKTSRKGQTEEIRQSNKQRKSS